MILSNIEYHPLIMILHVHSYFLEKCTGSYLYGMKTYKQFVNGLI